MIKKFLAEHRDEVLEIAGRYGARNVRIFGSVGRGEERPESDLDLVVEFDADRSLLDQVGLTQDVEKLLGRKVHVTTADALHWYIHDRVMEQAIPL
jgi:predicted nucleotidyltransferase